MNQFIIIKNKQIRSDKNIFKLFDSIGGVIRVIILEKKFLKNKNYWGFYYGGGIGDLITFAKITDELCKQRGGDIVFLFGPKNFAWIQDLLLSKRIHYISQKKISQHTLRFLSWERTYPKPGLLCPMHPWWLTSINAYFRKTLLDSFLIYLGLHPETVPENLRLPNRKEIVKAEAFMKQNSLPVGKTAFLFPLAFSVPNLNDENFGWNFIISELISYGLTIAINGDDRIYIKNDMGGKIKKIFPPLSLVRSLAALDNVFICRRSGIADLLIGSSNNLIVVYGMEPIKPSLSEYSRYSLQLMKMGDRVTEISSNRWWEDVLKNIIYMAS